MNPAFPKWRIVIRDQRNAVERTLELSSMLDHQATFAEACIRNPDKTVELWQQSRALEPWVRVSRAEPGVMP